MMSEKYDLIQFKISKILSDDSLAKKIILLGN
jgi:hypothetical protein